MNTASPDEAALTYRLPLTDSWARIRLDGHADGDVESLLDVGFAGIPDEAAAPARAALTQRFAVQITAARARSGLDLYVPADPVRLAGGAAGPTAVILAAEVVIPAATAPDPVEVVSRVAAANPAARTGVVGGTPAVRIDHSALTTAAEDGAADPDPDAAPRSRHIEYVVAVPNDPAHRWLSVALTAQAPAADQGLDAAVADFDQAVAALEF